MRTWVLPTAMLVAWLMISSRMMTMLSNGRVQRNNSALKKFNRSKKKQIGWQQKRLYSGNKRNKLKKLDVFRHLNF